MTDNLKSPICLYATQRSGSTPVAFALGDYFKSQYGIPNYMEFLNHFLKDPYYLDSKLVFDPSAEQKNIKQMHLMFPESPFKSADERMAILKKHKGEFFFKFFPVYLKDHHRNYIFENFRTIALYRKNLHDQLLSYLISSSTGVWYKQPKDPVIHPHSLEAKKFQFDHFIESWTTFTKDLRSFPNENIICFEDFLEHGPYWLYEKLSLPKIKSDIRASTTEIQNFGDKSRFFKNIDQINSWYRNSELHVKFPLK